MIPKIIHYCWFGNNELSELAKKCIAGIVNDQERDLHDPINEDAKIILITTDDLDHGFHILNHSTAHVMAQAILRLFPNAKITIGPSIDEGFYYDIDADNEIKESDLPRIEKEMQKIAANALDFSHKEVSYDEALEIFKDNPYKLYLINKIKDNGEKITIYQQGDFTDLCRGIHVDNTKRIQHFKLLNIAGAYWLGDSDNKMLQRIYGTSWFTKEQLDYLESTFPENTLVLEPNEMYYQLGRRSVVAQVRFLIEQAQKRTQELQ